MRPTSSQARAASLPPSRTVSIHRTSGRPLVGDVTGVGTELDITLPHALLLLLNRRHNIAATATNYALLHLLPLGLFRYIAPLGSRYVGVNGVGRTLDITRRMHHYYYSSEDTRTSPPTPYFDKNRCKENRNTIC
eukprot:scaffold373_cov78-Skeletonema_dohrnii-CCMP3373.AAC.3